MSDLVGMECNQHNTCVGCCMYVYIKVCIVLATPEHHITDPCPERMRPRSQGMTHMCPTHTETIIMCWMLFLHAFSSVIALSCKHRCGLQGAGRHAISKGRGQAVEQAEASRAGGRQACMQAARAGGRQWSKQRKAMQLASRHASVLD